MSMRWKGKGRSSSPFVMLHWMILDSQGWHDLSVYTRLAYLELVRKHNPKQGNNGRIAMSARDLAARLGCSKATSARALTELENAGFIQCMKIGTFKRKDRHASEYRINIFRCDVTGDTPNRAWNTAKWGPPNGLSRETVRSHMEDGIGPKPAPQSHQPVCARQNRPPNGLAGETHLDIYQGEKKISAMQAKARLHAGIGPKGRLGSA